MFLRPAILITALAWLPSNALAQCCCGCSTMAGVILDENDWNLTRTDSVYLTVSVPEKAEIFVNNDPTVAQGTTRYYVVRHLEEGKQYKFSILAKIPNAAGVMLGEKVEVVLTAGERKDVVLAPYKRFVPEPIKAEVSEEAGAAE